MSRSNERTFARVPSTHISAFSSLSFEHELVFAFDPFFGFGFAFALVSFLVDFGLASFLVDLVGLVSFRTTRDCNMVVEGWRGA